MTSHSVLAATDEISPAQDIYRQLRGLRLSGQLGANERLPTVRQTAADLGVSPATAAKAYKLLEQDGLVVSRLLPLIENGIRYARAGIMLTDLRPADAHQPSSCSAMRMKRPASRS